MLLGGNYNVSSSSSSFSGIQGSQGPNHAFLELHLLSDLSWANNQVSLEQLLLLLLLMPSHDSLLLSSKRSHLLLASVMQPSVFNSSCPTTTSVIPNNLHNSLLLDNILSFLDNNLISFRFQCSQFILNNLVQINLTFNNSTTHLLRTWPHNTVNNNS